MKSLHSNSQFCCKHVGFSYIFAKGIIARDTLPKAKEEFLVHSFLFFLSLSFTFRCCFKVKKVNCRIGVNSTIME